MQAADVGLQVAAGADDLANVVLDISSKSSPVLATATKSWQVMEVGMRLLDRAELVAVIEAVFMACSVHQPEFVAEVALGPFKEPMRHAAKGSDSCTSGNEHRILVRLPQGEHAVGSVELDRRALFQIAQPVGQESVFNPVETQVE